MWVKKETGCCNLQFASAAAGAGWWVGNEPIFQLLFPPDLSMSNGNVLHKGRGVCWRMRDGRLLEEVGEDKGVCLGPEHQPWHCSRTANVTPSYQRAITPGKCTTTNRLDTAMCHQTENVKPTQFHQNRNLSKASLKSSPCEHCLSWFFKKIYAILGQLKCKWINYFKNTNCLDWNVKILFYYRLPFFYYKLTAYGATKRLGEEAMTDAIVRICHK